MEFCKSNAIINNNINDRNQNVPRYKFTTKERECKDYVDILETKFLQNTKNVGKCLHA